MLFQAGQHAIVYGERGVGKTSLISVMADILSSKSIKILSLRTNCDPTDTFSTIWRKALDRAQIKEEIPGSGFVPNIRELTFTASEALPRKKVTPGHVRTALQVLGGMSSRTVIFIDEFDRLRDVETRNMFADTIKTLSDHRVPVTLVLVGIADNIDELIAQHQSVERALVQIRMPRMSHEELSDIVTRGLADVGMTIKLAALRRIADLSQGLPHYAHLLGLLAARTAVRAFRNEIETSDVKAAIGKAMEKAQQSIIDSYYSATLSSHNSIYDEVLLACALAKKEDLGYFVAADVRDPLSEIMKRRYEIQAFARHLNALTQEARGPVLQKKTTGRRCFYRFVNPLFQPYVIMRGLSSDKIDPSIMIGH